MIISFLQKHIKKALLAFVIFGLLGHLMMRMSVLDHYTARTSFTVTFDDISPEPFATVQYADWITETVSSWMNADDYNNNFRSRLLAEGVSYRQPNIYKSARMTLTSDMTTYSHDDAEKINTANIVMIRDEITRYNDSLLTGSKIVVTNEHFAIQFHQNSYLLSDLVFAVIGFILILIYILIRDYTAGIILSRFQIVDILGTEALAIMNKNVDRKEIKEFDIFASGLDKSAPIFVGLGFRLPLSFSSTLIWPTDIKKIKSYKNIIFVIRVGETVESDLRQAAAIDATRYIILR